MRDTVEKPAPAFPDHVKTAPLLVLDYALLQKKDEQECARLFDACTQLGFFYLKNAKLDATSMFESAQTFFECPVSDKLVYDMGTSGNYFGYKGLGGGVIDSKGTLDKHERYNISRDDTLGLSSSPRTHPPCILESMPDFAAYTKQSLEIIGKLLDRLSTLLGLPENTLRKLHRLSQPSGDMIRLLLAPSGTTETSEQSMGAHTDFGSITLLQNNVGGLQVLLPGRGEWVYVKPIPDYLIVNCGDALVRFSNGLLRSNLHRVISPPGEQAKVDRYSVVYFSRPEDQVLMKPLKGGVIPPSTEEFEDVTSEQWILNRVKHRIAYNFKGSESWEISLGTDRGRIV